MVQVIYPNTIALVMLRYTMDKGLRPSCIIDSSKVYPNITNATLLGNCDPRKLYTHQ